MLKVRGGVGWGVEKRQKNAARPHGSVPEIIKHDREDGFLATLVCKHRDVADR